jgi:hypothetical protein
VKTLHFSQWEASKSRSLRNVTLHLKYSIQGTTGRENDMENTFVLHGIKSAQFKVSWNFNFACWLKIQGTLGQKLSQPINFNYEQLYFKKYIKKLNSLLCGPFSLYTTSKGCQVERPIFQEWTMALEKFSLRLLISSIKRAWNVEKSIWVHLNAHFSVVYNPILEAQFTILFQNPNLQSYFRTLFSVDTMPERLGVKFKTTLILHLKKRRRKR